MMNNNDIILLDGSIGQEILKKSGDQATPLWSTKVMMEKPGIVDDVHESYFKSGATVATTNTYPVHYDRLKRVGLEKERFKLWDIAVDSAINARNKHGYGKVAASIGPLIASYRPDICPPAKEAKKIYDVKYGAYANGFTKITSGFLKDAPTVDALEERKDLNPESYSKFVMEWVNLGATIVGGCCEVGPDHIKLIAQKLNKSGYNIV